MLKQQLDITTHLLQCPKSRTWTAPNAGCEATGTLIHCWWECKMVQPLWKTAWQFLTKLNILLLYNPAITLLGIYLKEMKSYVHTKTYTKIFVAIYS